MEWLRWVLVPHEQLRGQQGLTLSLGSVAAPEQEEAEGGEPAHVVTSALSPGTSEVLVDVKVVVAPAWSQVCVVFHSPENSTQEVPVSPPPPPQAAPPVWEWEKRGAGRSGSAHSRHPSARSSSTEARGASPSPGPARPPLTRITELTE